MPVLSGAMEWDAAWCARDSTGTWAFLFRAFIVWCRYQFNFRLAEFWILHYDGDYITMVEMLQSDVEWWQ